jgi:hypothetical protein
MFKNILNSLSFNKEAFHLTVKISDMGLKGLEGYRVQVQVHVSEGKESMVIVGLPDPHPRVWMADSTPKKTLDMLRQLLELGKVTISRAQSTVTYPPSFTLIAP